MVSRTRLLLPLILCVASSCSQFMTFHVHPGSCINPAQSYCDEGGGDSRWLDVRIYQLKQPVDPCKLDLDAFKEGREFAVLKGMLSNKDRLDLVMLKFPVDRNDPKSLPKWQIQPGTTTLLIVALGRGRGKNSMRTMDVDVFVRSTALYFSEYDVCINAPCSASKEQCP